MTVRRRWHGWGGGLSTAHAAAATAVTRVFCVVLRATLTILQRRLHGTCCVYRRGQGSGVEGQGSGVGGQGALSRTRLLQRDGVGVVAGVGLRRPRPADTWGEWGGRYGGGGRLGQEEEASATSSCSAASWKAPAVRGERMMGRGSAAAGVGGWGGGGRGVPTEGPWAAPHARSR